MVHTNKDKRKLDFLKGRIDLNKGFIKTSHIILKSKHTDKNIKKSARETIAFSKKLIKKDTKEIKDIQSKR